MAEESLQLPPEHNLDYHIVSLFERLEILRKEQNQGAVIVVGGRVSRPSMQAEIRTLEFWRSIISECIASFFYVFIVCGAAAGAGVGASVSSVLLATALASGFAVATLTQCFSHISGAHINPAVTLALSVVRMVSPLRAVMYITAQCGGGIAGAALLYGVTVPGYQGNLQAAISHSSALAAWERFGVEFILTFVVVLAYFVSTESYRRYLGASSLTIGAAYSACSFVSMPYLNPARSLGPSFVLNKWDNHWVYWMGPMVGGMVCGLLYEYIFSPKRYQKRSKDSGDNDSSSLQSEDEMDYHVDIEKPTLPLPKFHGSAYNTYRSAGGVTTSGPYPQNLYSTAPQTKMEPIYGGTRSLYCKSPPLTRANLNRSQSVYTKSNTAINRDMGALPRPGPLVPAQSLYPLRVTQTQSSHLQNQNVQNQMQQRSESIYGIRTAVRQNENQTFQPIYGTRTAPSAGDGLKYDRESRRPDSVYGVSGARNRGQSAQSDDSSYGSYHGSSLTPTGRIGASQQPNGDIPLNTYSCTRGQNDRKPSGNGHQQVPPPPPPGSGYGCSAKQQQQQQQQQQNCMAAPPPPPLQHQYLHPIRQQN
ncbi:neurogenic protein big brain [Phlebotomus argentipes]|uniref:neurogenic protein big brain n=1 Tax=Phlebotomus argentipes TaxID=94469 RepID=UPI002892DF5D|nr:neurogenic protein big brain [Phlebotomus argentipes]